MTYRHNSSYLDFKKSKNKSGLGSASEFISFAKKQQHEKEKLQDSPAITWSQNVYDTLD